MCDGVIDHLAQQLAVHCVPWQIFFQKTNGDLQNAGPGPAEPGLLSPTIGSVCSFAYLEIPGAVKTLPGVLSP